MTITSETNRIGPLPGNGAATVFSFSPMQVLSVDDLLVIKVESDGTEVALTRGSGPTNYSVSVPSFPGTGSITYPASGGTPLAANENLVIVRDLDFTQLTVLENQGGYFPKVQEGVFDRLTILLQQLKEELGRALKITLGQSAEDADEFVAELLAAASTATAAAAAAEAAAEAAALFDPSNYVAKAGDTMTGALNIDPVGDDTNPRISLLKNSTERADISRSVPGGNILFISQRAGTGFRATIQLNPVPLDGVAPADVDFFRNSATSGTRALRFFYDDGDSDIASTIAVRNDGLNVSGGVHFTSATWEDPIRIAGLRLWNDDSTNDLRWRRSTDPVSQTNGALVSVFEQRFTSDLLTIDSTTDTYSVAHGLSITPKSIRPVLVCQTAQHGYAIGDEVEIKAWQTDGDANEGFTVWANSTNVGVSHIGLRIMTLTASAVSAITPANWRMKIYAWA